MNWMYFFINFGKEVSVNVGRVYVCVGGGVLIIILNDFAGISNVSWVVGNYEVTRNFLKRFHYIRKFFNESGWGGIWTKIRCVHFT